MLAQKLCLPELSNRTIDIYPPGCDSNGEFTPRMGFVEWIYKHTLPDCGMRRFVSESVADLVLHKHVEDKAGWMWKDVEDVLTANLDLVVCSRNTPLARSVDDKSLEALIAVIIHPTHLT